VKPKEALKDAKPRPAEGGAWRRPSGPKPPRNDAPRGPRGDGPPRGPRNEGPRGRANGGEPPAPAAPAAPAAQQGPETAALEEDGWSTVSKPKKNQRGGNHAPRAIAS
jgi:translation initiation factor 4B